MTLSELLNWLPYHNRSRVYVIYNTQWNKSHPCISLPATCILQIKTLSCQCAEMRKTMSWAQRTSNTGNRGSKGSIKCLWGLLSLHQAKESHLLEFLLPIVRHNPLWNPSQFPGHICEEIYHLIWIFRVLQTGAASLNYKLLLQKLLIPKTTGGEDLFPNKS